VIIQVDPDRNVFKFEENLKGIRQQRLEGRLGHTHWQEVQGLADKGYAPINADDNAGVF
jgi:hypothetical protein